MLQIICIIFVINLGMRIQADIYTATSDLVYLVEAHKTIIDFLYQYLERHTQRLTIIRSYLDIFKRENKRAMVNASKYLDNPINIFKFTKRLTADVNYINSSIEDESDYLEDIIRKYHTNKYPKMVDLLGAAQALVRLQFLYQMKVKDMAEGKLNGIASSKADVKYEYHYTLLQNQSLPEKFYLLVTRQLGRVYVPSMSLLFEELFQCVLLNHHPVRRTYRKDGISFHRSPMTAGDCYELGQVLYNDSDFRNGILWILVAFRKYHEERNQYPFSEIEILEHISIGYIKLGNFKTALEWIMKVFKLDPDHPRAHRIAQDCRRKMLDIKYRTKEANKHKKEKKSRKEKGDEYTYSSLCRGDMEIRIEVSSRLTCRYMTENHPFLKLAPFKIEMLYLNPDIVRFYDVLSDSEIENVLELSRRKLVRSVIQRPGNSTANTQRRISKTAMFQATASFAFNRISRRVSHMTGLSLDGAEDMQVANYGIGGFYTLHNDFLKEMTKNRRIATLLFYLSDVAQGGATIFPHQGLSVFPKKASAIYWFNLHASGEPNHCLAHAGCPVLQGSKWIATQWLRQIGQEFIKPCNLEYQKEGCDSKFPRPILKTSRTKF